MSLFLPPDLLAVFPRSSGSVFCLLSPPSTAAIGTHTALYLSLLPVRTWGRARRIPRSLWGCLKVFDYRGHPNPEVNSTGGRAQRVSVKVQEGPGEHTEDARALHRGEMEIKQSKEIILGRMTGKGGQRAEDKLC